MAAQDSGRWLQAVSKKPAFATLQSLLAAAPGREPRGPGPKPTSTAPAAATPAAKAKRAAGTGERECPWAQGELQPAEFSAPAKPQSELVQGGTGVALALPTNLQRILGMQLHTAGSMW